MTSEQPIETARSNRRTIALIVGAGASIPSGLPTTQELLDVVLSSFPTERVTIDAQGKRTTSSVRLAALISEHVASVADGEVDFEVVMAFLEEMISYGMPGRVLRAFTQLHPAFESAMDTGMLQAAYQSAIRALVATFSSRGSQTVQHVEATLSLTRLVRTLAANSRIVLSTLNYDILLDDVLPWFDGFVSVPGWDFAEFEPSLWAELRKSSHLLMHLHGSMRFGFRPVMAQHRSAPFSEPVRYISSDLAADSVFRSSTGSPTADGLLLPATPIIAGGHKSPKLVHNVRPYAYYNAASLHEIANADALVIIGYGFRDEHVNAWINEYIRNQPNGPLALITKRTGQDIGEPTATERFLMKLSRGGHTYDTICESAQDDEGSNASHGLFGSAYVATAGMPLEEEVERALFCYLFNEEHKALAFDFHEVEAYVGRRARVTRRGGSTLVGTIKKSDGDRIAIAGRNRARHIRFADIVKVEPAPDGVPDTD